MTSILHTSTSVNVRLEVVGREALRNAVVGHSWSLLPRSAPQDPGPLAWAPLCSTLAWATLHLCPALATMTAIEPWSSMGPIPQVCKTWPPCLPLSQGAPWGLSLSLHRICLHGSLATPGSHMRQVPALLASVTLLVPWEPGEVISQMWIIFTVYARNIHFPAVIISWLSGMVPDWVTPSMEHSDPLLQGRIGSWFSKQKGITSGGS